MQQDASDALLVVRRMAIAQSEEHGDRVSMSGVLVNLIRRATGTQSEPV